MNRLLLTSVALFLLIGFTADVSAQDTDAKNGDAKAAAPDGEKTNGKEDDQKKDDENKEATEETKPEIKPLTIGSKAPSLDIEHWVQTGDGEFPEVTDFEKDKVYIVEFWATWCGPCISSMPHIAEIQNLYADRGVQVISISDEPLETVEAFLDREVRGSEDGQTYRDLTRGYCLTTDPDESVSRDYMRAAKRNGIPCAFIVGKQGEVEWIGHPVAMDKALEEIVSDNWDRDAFRVEYIAEQKAREILSQLSRLMRSNKVDEAVDLLDDYIENGELESQKSRFKQIKFQVLASDKEHADQAAEYGVELTKEKSLDATSANALAWNIYMLAQAGRYEDDRVTDAALKLAQSKVKESGEDRPYLLDTVAHLLQLKGQTERALKVQKRAVKAATPEQKERVIGFLKELESLQQEMLEKAKQEANKDEPEKGDAEKKADAKKGDAEVEKAQEKGESTKAKKSKSDAPE